MPCTRTGVWSPVIAEDITPATFGWQIGLRFGLVASAKEVRLMAPDSGAIPRHHRASRLKLHLRARQQRQPIGRQIGYSVRAFGMFKIEHRAGT